METKPLAYGIVGFLLGGLVVSIAATLEDDDDSHGSGSLIVEVVTTPTDAPSH